MGIGEVLDKKGKDQKGKERIEKKIRISFGNKPKEGKTTNKMLLH